MDTPSISVLGAACALASACTWAVNSMLVRSLIPPFGPVGVNALRSAMSGAVLVVGILVVAGPAPFTRVDPDALWRLAVSIVAAIAVGDTVFFESTRHLGVARALTVSMTYPLLAALLAALFLSEPITLPVAAGTLLTLAGLGLIVSERVRDGQVGRFWLGVAAASLAALAWAASVVLLKPALRDIDAATAQAIRLPLAAAILWATPWARGAVDTLRASTPAVRRRVVGLSVLTAVSSIMFVASVKYAGVAVASVLSSTAPMFAIPLGVLFLGERTSALAVGGTVVTMIGIAVLHL